MPMPDEKRPVLVTKELVESLHEQGFTIVTRHEWYEVQNKLAKLERLEQGEKTG